jgi:hypothetical protein
MVPVLERAGKLTESLRHLRRVFYFGRLRMNKTGGKKKESKITLKRECVKGYQWPASALTSHEMALLEGWREKTGVPITQLLRQCVLKIEREIKIEV